MAPKGRAPHPRRIATVMGSKGLAAAAAALPSERRTSTAQPAPRATDSAGQRRFIQQARVRSHERW